MKYADRVRAAATPHEALVILAELGDTLLERLAEVLDSTSDGWGSASDGWAAWVPDSTSDGWGAGGSSGGTEPTPTAAVLAPQPDAYDVIRTEPDLKAIAAAEERVRRAEQVFETERAKGNLEPGVIHELQAAQAALRLAQDPGDILVGAGEVFGEKDTSLIAELNGDSHVIDLPVADQRRRELRRAFAERIDLPGFFEPIMRGSEEQRQQLIDTYVKGGPLWLAPRRDIIMAMPVAARQVMIADLREDSERIAWDYGRDWLKVDVDEGSTLAVAEDNIQGVVAQGAPAYKGRD